MATLRCVLACLLVVSLVQGVPRYAQEIPNGNGVPNPKVEGETWTGVGHTNSGGGGELNPFGQDFKTNGFKWTVQLCRNDSDGDGLTNGQELGDPNCIWKKGDTPTSLAVSHPGVANPNKNPVSRPGLPVPKPALPVPKPALPVPKPALPVPKPALPVPKPAAPAAKSAVPVPRPVAPVKRPAEIAPKPAASDPKPAAPVPKPAAPFPKPVVLVPKPAAPVPKRAVPA